MDQSSLDEDGCRIKGVEIRAICDSMLKYRSVKHYTERFALNMLHVFRRWTIDIGSDKRSVSNRQTDLATGIDAMEELNFAIFEF